MSKKGEKEDEATSPRIGEDEALDVLRIFQGEERREESAHGVSGKAKPLQTQRIHPRLNRFHEKLFTFVRGLTYRFDIIDQHTRLSLTQQDRSM